MKRVRYDVDEVWVDPYDHPEDRRRTPRVVLRLRAKIAADDKKPGFYILGPAVIKDASVGGVNVTTKHHLRPDDVVQLAVRTHQYPHNLILPRAFIGPATVLRVELLADEVSEVALALGEEFAESMEWAQFIEHLFEVKSIKTRRAHAADIGDELSGEEPS